MNDVDGAVESRAMAYRGSAKDAPVERLDDEGIVGDLVKQFADPLAFYRELVQNAIDAGASAIHVHALDAGDTFRLSVRDDGEGMTPEVMQDRLLVLFRSGKENQEDKIGKFGVGFVSVLALSPERVLVQTSRGDGEAWTLHLYPDHRYELFESGGGQRAGTTVTLEVAKSSWAGTFEELAARSTASLRLWCEHATVPIHFAAHVEGRAAPLRDERIDAPLGLPDCLVSASLTAGYTHVVVGLPASPHDRVAGFYNRGLTLHRSDEGFSGPLGVLSFKVQDLRLEHTLSRDNVRRDSAFRRAMKQVERAARDALPAAVLRALGEHATSDGNRYAQIVQRACEYREVLPLSGKAVPVPLLEPLDGRDVIRVGDASELWHATASTKVTAHLAARGAAVLDANAAGTTYDSRNRFLALVGNPKDAAEVTLIEPVRASPSDLALTDAVLRSLGEAHRKPGGAQLVRLHGGKNHATFVVGRVAEEPHLVEKLSGDPFRALARPAVLLNVDDALVQAARRRAEDDVQLAGALLARDILLAFRVLTDNRDLALTENALEEVLS